MNVFVVENDAGFAHFLAVVAEQCGCQVSVYYPGQSASHDAPISTPDVVLLSLSLVDMDGLEFVRRFRQHRALQCTSIVAVSGDLNDRASARAFNVDTRLLHPWREPSVERIMQTLAIAADQPARCFDLRSRAA